MRQKQTQLTSFRLQLAQTKAVWHEKDKESATSAGFGARLAILCAAVPEEGVSKPRWGSELHQTQSCQPGYQGQQQPTSAEWRN